ncbi:hypothetical protein Bp8pC_012 [Bacillus phage Bp8p-C]|uniref:Uncharacterized protein n=2 Tax=Agatevirus Bp8pC TaxID=1910937 RepID=A0A0A0PJ16_9CAUD|nr:hypothetical protein AXJ20_gp012 [Bacillus phage Bp8p-C]YP_009784313.1 hypothetical protein QLX39_gp012 [Bacillus phage Bp8p-T]AHJ87443.1 hypothetical protein Bp8pC_012 [Bacillus phage Bp8p-C]AHJ87654.1 hypothetical protein Bp8pT_012 [Bacillus phage Bp8p-T]
MADLCMLIEVSRNDVSRIKEDTLNWITSDGDVMQDMMEPEEIVEQIMSQLSTVSDCLLFVSANYQCEVTHDFDGTHYEDLFVVDRCVILTEDYQNVSRRTLTKRIFNSIDVYAYDRKKIDSDTDELYWKYSIEDWEEFHEEYFTPVTEQTDVGRTFMEYLNEEFKKLRGE